MSDSRIDISIDDQTLKLTTADQTTHLYPISSASKGTGTQPNSNRTPTGQLKVAEMIGTDAPSRTIFEGRRATGVWDGNSHQDHDLILSRILWLEGLDDDNSNTRERYIYIHGTNHSERLGKPCSCGCIRMSESDVIDLYSKTEVGTEVMITPPTKTHSKLIFFDCDSTLSSIEGIDELARARGPEVFAEVEALTHAAMNGEIPIQEVFPRRMEIIKPDKKLCEQVAEQYIATITEGTSELISDLKTRNWIPVILSGGFSPLIKPLAKHLGIEHVEAVPMHFDANGDYAGFDGTYATTRNGGKPEIIREWKEAMLPLRTVMVGDGISDLETETEVDLFVGYGGVVARNSVKQKAKIWLERLSDFPARVYPLIGEDTDNK